jgi:hypothetical protein
MEAISEVSNGALFRAVLAHRRPLWRQQRDMTEESREEAHVEALKDVIDQTSHHKGCKIAPAIIEAFDQHGMNFLYAAVWIEYERGVRGIIHANS